MSTSIEQITPNKKIIYKASEKSLDVHDRSEFCKYVVLEGAVRSSKSFTSNDLAIREIQALPDCNILISGHSITSVARNVIAEWEKIIDPHGLGLFKTVKTSKDEYLTINWRGLRGKKFYIRGACKANDAAQIQGATFGYWYADEVTKHHKSFVQMAMSRMSLDYSKAVWTMNPEGPNHYIKTDYLDKPHFFQEDETGYSNMKRWTFFLEDNPSLSQRVIDEYYGNYSGVFFRRYILSQWVAAEGVIYDFFEENDFFIQPLSAMPKPLYKAVSIDYGTSNPTSFGLYGISPRTHVKAWRERAYYYNCKDFGKGHKEKWQKTDSEIVDDLIEFIKGENVRYIIIDPSAASLKAELRKRNLGITIKDAKNDVIDGIRKQMSMLKDGEYKIIDHPTNQQCIRDYSAYLWDERAQTKGEDKPIKEDDHTKDEERYLLYTIFHKKPIDYSGA
jgi:PBSX family phage terminase large subunit